MPREGGDERRALVRGRAVLRLPPAQRLRGRRHDRARRGPPPERMFDAQPARPVRQALPTLDAVDGRPAAGKVLRGAAGRPGPGVPAGRRAAASAGGTDTATRSASPMSEGTPSTRCSSTTSRGVRRQARGFGQGTRRPGSSSSCPARPDAAEDDGVLMGFVYDAATAAQRPDDPRRRDPGDRGRHPPARPRARTASTATGSPASRGRRRTPPAGAGRPRRAGPPGRAGRRSGPRRGRAPRSRRPR